ncbi:MAG: hypothetical protein FWF57_04145 [Defluviitaleaceae bacterium]|nr:hypothetical protein [Defluviitaleaceae bacterium]
MNDKLRKMFKGKNLTNLIVIGVLGLVLLILSSNIFGDEEEPVLAPLVQAQNNTGTLSYARQLEIRLEEAFRNVAGVGEVIVMVTLAHGPHIIVAQDTVLNESSTTETDANGGTRSVVNRIQNLNHVISGGMPLILTETNPAVEGVIIVAEGGGDVRIVQSLVNATRAVLGIEAHRVSVLEMN